MTTARYNEIQKWVYDLYKADWHKLMFAEDDEIEKLRADGTMEGRVGFPGSGTQELAKDFLAKMEALGVNFDELHSFAIIRAYFEHQRQSELMTRIYAGDFDDD